jgi:hypothetical protein
MEDLVELGLDKLEHLLIHVIEETIQETVTTGQESRTGTQTFITETFDVSSTGVRQISTDLVKFMRSRNVQIVAKRLKPNTRLYGFFDGVEVTNYCIPKLLDISMVSGVFPGRRDCNWNNEYSSGLNRNIPGVTPRISFRLSSFKA